MGRRPLPERRASEEASPFLTSPLAPVSSWGISDRFQPLSPSPGQVTYVFLTRSPLYSARHRSLEPFAFDLHVLGTPPAFILSQDQTLRKSSLPPLAGVVQCLLVRAPLAISCAGSHFLPRPVASAIVKVPVAKSFALCLPQFQNASHSALHLRLSKQTADSLGRRGAADIDIVVRRLVGLSGCSPPQFSSPEELVPRRDW